MSLLEMLKPQQPMMPSGYTPGQLDPAALPTVEEILAGVDARAKASPTGQLLDALRASRGLPGMTMGTYNQLSPDAQAGVNSWSSGFGDKPDALAELIRERGGAITSGGQTVPNGIPLPGVRSLPLGIGGGTEGWSKTADSAVRSQDQIDQSAMKARGNMIANEGYVPWEGKAPRPGMGGSFIGTPEGYIHLTSPPRETPEAEANRISKLDQMNNNRAVKRDEAQKLLTLIGQGKAADRRMSMGDNISALPDILNILRSSSGGNFADPAVAAMFPQLAQAQLAQQGLNNQTTTANAHAMAAGNDANGLAFASSPIGAIVSKQRSGQPLTPQEMVLYENWLTGQGGAGANAGSAQVDPVFGELPKPNEIAAYDAIKATSIPALLDQMPAIPPGDAFQHYLNKRFGVDAYNAWKADKARRSSRGGLSPAARQEQEVMNLFSG